MAPSDAAVDAGGAAEEVTILRDEYGVPHVFAATSRAAAYALGWTNGEDLGAPALELVYFGTGEATRRLGASCDACPTADLFALAYRIPDTVEAEYASLPPDVREWIESYAAGLSAYFESHPDPAYDPADPPSGRMVAMSHLYLRASHALSEMQRGITEGGGSNQLAVTGARTRGAATLILKDPHNPWQRSQVYAHLSIAGFELFGNFALGAMGCGSNSNLAFGCTRAGPTPGIRIEAQLRHASEHAAEGTCAAAPAYEIFDHAASGFTPLPMRCLDVNGTGTWLYESRFGPASAFGPDTNTDGHPDTVTFTHLFAVGDVAAVTYRVRGGLARSADEYLALFAGPTPPEDAQYRAFGDRQHRIGAVLGATTPALDPAIDWTRVVSSTDPRIDSWTSSRDWGDLSAGRWHNLDGSPPELPHVVDPAGDFFENCNGNPRFGTDPQGQIGDVPVTLERWQVPTVRDVRMAELVRGATDLDLDGLVPIATDVRVPHAPELIAAARCGVTTLGVDPVTEWGDGGRVLQVLFEWSDAGGLARPDDAGATIMAILEAAFPMLVYPDAGACLTRPQLDALAGTAFRDAIAPYMRAAYASEFADPLRVPWGHVNYVLVDGREVGLPGMAVGRLTTLLPSSFTPDGATGRADPAAGHGGSALMQLTAYTESGLEIRILPPYGQISDEVHPSSPHLGQTLDAYAAREPRRVWLERAEIEAHLCPHGADPAHEHAARTTLSVP